jgi:flagellin-like protein
LWGFGGDRRAVSPVLSTVILVLLVVLGMSLVFAFFVDYVGDYQTGRGSSVMELVEIEDVYFRRVGGVDWVEVWLYNYGEIEFEVDSVYVNGVSVENFSFLNVSSVPLYDSDEDGSVEVIPYAHAKFNVTLSGGWVSPGKYVFRFVTERGSAVEREYPSP